MTRQLWVRDVDDDGLDVVTLGDHPVDVCIDGNRVWTFWSRRDTEPRHGPRVGPWPLRRAAWPRNLARHLNGRSRLTVRDSASGQAFFDEEVALGHGEGPILVRNQKGVDLGVDKSGRLVPTFAGRSEGNIASLLDATDAVIDALQSAGLEPFLAYGTLLGAVREGTVLGHDSDADIGYVSRHTHPVDVARESFEVQRHLMEKGWRISRYSGASFKIHVTEGDLTRGLDVFGGFLAGGRLYLMGEIGVEFEPEWIRPRTTATLDGRPMPVPARPEKLLEATYGPGWRVPDPAFKFTPPERTTRALDDWFRGLQPGIRYWQRRSRVMARRPWRGRPSAQARRAARISQRLGADVLDVGAGRGADSVWLARQGIAVTAYDYVPRALEAASECAARESLDLEVRHLNLTDWRSVYAEGARLARRPRPRVVLANHVVDATSHRGRESLARLCSMALREGGRLLAEFHLPTDDPSTTDLAWLVGSPDAVAFTRLLRDAGASEVQVKTMQRRGRPTVRVMGVWSPCS
jgi:SAM-dependent methyltransferase